MKRQFQKDLEAGKTIYEWNGFSPFYAGCFYGDSICLGGEKKFSQCYDFFSGIGDVEWWIVDELEKLSEKDKKELLHILKRNKRIYDYIKKQHSKIKEMSSELQLEGPHIIHRLGNRKILSLLLSKNIKETYERVKDNSVDVIETLIETLIETDEDVDEQKTMSTMEIANYYMSKRL